MRELATVALAWTSSSLYAPFPLLAGTLHLKANCKPPTTRQLLSVSKGSPDEIINGLYRRRSRVKSLNSPIRVLFILTFS